MADLSRGLQNPFLFGLTTQRRCPQCGCILLDGRCLDCQELSDLEPQADDEHSSPRGQCVAFDFGELHAVVSSLQDEAADDESPEIGLREVGEPADEEMPEPADEEMPETAPTEPSTAAPSTAAVAEATGRGAVGWGGTQG